VAAQDDSRVTRECSSVDFVVLNNSPRAGNALQTGFTCILCEIIKINSAESMWLRRMIAE
jgi:hypothetical protein